MVKQMTGLQVFIASPGGLLAERKAFADVIERVNRDHAHGVQVTFMPQGVEYALAGIGRPQELINQQVRESDYLVVVLWDKWGTPTGNGTYTSGTEEEYSVGLECLQDPGMPMRDIIVLFKGVNERQLADPGEDLRKVLDFKSELERSRILLYSTFDTLDEFCHAFRSHLHNWVRHWQGDEPPSKKTNPALSPQRPTASPAGAPETSLGGEGLTLAQQAKAAVDRGRYTLAEELFAQATTGVYDRDAQTEYVRYLRKSGRLSLARTVAETFLRLAQDADDHVAEIEALANLAILARQQGNNASSLDYLGRALKVVDELLRTLSSSDDDRRRLAIANRAFLLDNYSLTLRRMPGRAEDALEALKEARACQEEAGDPRGVGFTLRNEGSLLTRLGRLQEAEEALKQALKVFSDVEYANGQATALWSLGEVYEAMGENVKAIEMLDRAIAVSPARAPVRIANNYAVLARLHTKEGHLEQAQDFAEYCLCAAQDLGTPESRATALHVDAGVALAMGDHDRGIKQLHESLSLFTQVDNRVGVAAVRLTLARQLSERGDLDGARKNLSLAADLLEGAPHYALSKEMESLRIKMEDLRNDPKP